MNPVKYQIAKQLVKHSIKKSDFDQVKAESNFFVDRSVPEYNNSYYFTAHSVDGTAFMIRLAGRGNGRFELWFSVFLPDMGRFSVPVSVQDTIKDFENSPLTLTCIEPVKSWRLRYSGELEGEGKKIDVVFDTTLKSDFSLYHFTNDMDPSAHARAMAERKWTGEWFRKIQAMHQHHYEQGGDLKGFIEVDGVRRGLIMKYIRDHSFGPRSWDAMNRHIWLAVCLDNGDYLNLSIPEYPFFKMKAGFHACGATGKYTPVVDGSQFHDIAPDALPPEEFFVYIVESGGKRLPMTCKKGPGFTWLMDNDYRVFEWASDFVIDGIHGRGICEFGYNVHRFNYGSID